MKRIIACILAISFTLQGMAQQEIKDRQYYIDKSKRQKTTAWILAGTGTAMVVGGAIAFGKNFEVFGPGGETEGAIMLAGIPVGLASIPFFISSAKNKGRAEAAVSLQLKPVQYGVDRMRIVPAIMVKVDL